jgi:lysophospholipase L1-like esterase
MRPMFASRYSGVSVTVQNAGIPGERASTGRNRLPGLLTPYRDVVIILEGANDIIAQRSTANIAADLRRMVQDAKAAGSHVLLCTNPPALDTGKTYPEAIPPLNTEIRKIAADEGVTLVDLYAIFLGREGTYLSPDGLHPSEAGYDRMARAFFDVIVAWTERAVGDVPTTQQPASR